MKALIIHSKTLWPASLFGAVSSLLQAAVMYAAQQI